MRKLLLKTMLLLCALIVGSGNAWADNTYTLGWGTASGDAGTYTNFTATSGTVDGIVSFSTAKNDGTSGPYYNSNNSDLRLYYNSKGNGGSITLTPATGITITGFVMTTSTAPSVKYTVDSGTATSVSASNNTYTVTGISAGTSLMIQNVNTSNTQLRIKKIEITYTTSGGTPTCATPTFDPAAGAVVSGTTVSISSTEGATIYYTTNGTTPSTSSSVYSTPIEITAATTIKAFATKTDYNDSEVATAAYTIKPTVSGYAIDFENDVDCYVDWSFTNVGIHTTGVTSAHGGSAWGSNVNASDNGTQTAIIQTKEKVAYPDVFTCYISKESSNTTSSTWYIQVSSDGSTWNDIASLSSMTQNTWTEFTGNIKAAGYTNVYVRLYYNGSNAKRAVDDISLTTYAPAAVEAPSITVTSPFMFSTSVSMSCVTDGATIYYTTDGTAPTSSSTAYTEPFNINATTTIKAIAIKNSDESTVTEVTATKELATPTVAISTSSINIGATATVTTDGPAVTLSTSDASIASVSGTTVTGVAAGSATITATWSANGDYSAGTQDFTVTVTDPNAPGSENNPYTVAQAIAYINTLGSSTSANDVYVSGIISQVDSYNSTYSSITYWISDDGTTTSQMEVYSGKGIDGANFSAMTDLEVGDVVTVKGKVKMFKSTPEFDKNNQLVSHTTKTASNLTKTDDISLSMANPSVTATATNFFTTSSTGALSYEIADESVATVNAEGVVTPVAAGTTTLTVSQAADATYKAGSLEITVTVAAASLNSTTIVANASGSTTYGTNKEEGYMIDDTYDGTVTAVSGNPAVATVAITQHTAGEGTFTITPVAVGTAVITISAPATATCEAATDVTYTITVTAPVGGTTAAPASVDPVTIDFTSNAFSLPTSSSDAKKGDITDGTYTLNVSGGNGAYYFSDGDALLMGKSGATLKLPTFNNKITKIEVTGSSKAGTSVKQNIFVGETAVSTETTGAKDVTNVYEIDSEYQVAGTQYLLKVTSAHNTQISSIKIYFASTDLSVKLNTSGYATYCSEYPLYFSEAEDNGYSAWYITETSGEAITFEKVTGSVKGGTGLFLMGAASSTITLTSDDSDNTLSRNKLVGTLAPTYFEEDEIYGLSGNTFKLNNAGTFKANKAYIPAYLIDGNGESARAFTFVFVDPTTGITETRNVSAEEFGEIFNLAGQRMNKPQKGVNIINGKKVLVK